MQNENQLDPKMVAYLNQLYEGVLPKNFIELFKIALFHVPPAAHNQLEPTLKAILSADHLTIGQVGICQGIIRSCPPNYLYQDLNQFLHVNAQIDKIKQFHTQALMQVQVEIDNERRNKAKILSGNGMHKI